MFTHNQFFPGGVFATPLPLMVNQSEPLIQLRDAINWQNLCTGISKFYSDGVGRPHIDLRLIISILILKNIYNLSDEAVLTNWSQNIIFQAFSNCAFFINEIPFDPSLLCKFRQRIGKEGLELIFSESVSIHGESVLEKEVILDTTVQKKYTAFPTDTRLRLNVIDQCLAMADHLDISFDNYYQIEIVDAKKIVNFTKSTKKDEAKLKKDTAINTIKDIANHFLDELSSKAHIETKSDPIFIEAMANYRKAVNQQKKDKNKIYSIYEPHIACIAKGKSHVKYEFGNKVSLAIGLEHKIALGVVSFTGNPYDGDTVSGTLSMMERCHNGYKPETAIADLGYRGRSKVLGVDIITPDLYRNETDLVIKTELGLKLRQRSSIEPIIGHMKSDQSLGLNRLHGVIGDHINALSAGIGFNLRKYLNLCGLNDLSLPDDRFLRIKQCLKRKRLPKCKTKKVPFIKPKPIEKSIAANILQYTA
jgi:IS5 family transposase